jgi:predicted DCC family thiol-disulfide oxidoreductase YuxK
VNFALDFDRKGEFRFAALQSEAGRALLQRSGRRPDDVSSIVLVDQKGAYVKSEAVLRIASKLGSVFPVLVRKRAPLSPTLNSDCIFSTVHDDVLCLKSSRNRYRPLIAPPFTCRASFSR